MNVIDRDRLVDTIHTYSDDHPPENFRGCTHPDCKALQRILIEVAQLRAALKFWLDEFGTFALPKGHEHETWEDAAIRKSNEALADSGGMEEK